MNKGEFINYMSSHHQISKSDAEKSLDMIIKSITQALSDKEEISLVGFGSFKVQQKSARVGRHPKTGAPLEIAASMSPVFKAGKLLKDACNS